MWESSKIILDKFNLEHGEMFVSAVFMIATMTLNVFITMPFTVYNTFVLEEKHGFNKQVCAFNVSIKTFKFIYLNLTHYGKEFI